MDDVKKIILLDDVTLMKITDVRSPAVIASVGNFVEKFFIKLGVTLQTSQVSVYLVVEFVNSELTNSQL